MKIILLVIFVVATHASRATEFGELSRPAGTWSNVIEADPEFKNLPAQYFLCGFQLRSIKQTRVIDCNCSHRFYRWRRTVRCNKCQVQNLAKTAGIRATFCRKDNWNDQISKIFQTESSAASQWRNTFTCPRDQYAQSFAVRLANDFGQDVGLSGMSLRCSTVNLKSIEVIRDTQSYALSEFYNAAPGKFISGLQIKYQGGSNLLGIKANFEAMAKISEIFYSYQTSLQLTSSPVILQSIRRQNCGNQQFETTLNFQKNYQASVTWKTNDTYTKYITIPKSVGYDSLPLSDATSSNVYAASPDFGFNKAINIEFSSPQTITVLVGSKSSKTINRTLIVQKARIPFSAKLTIIDQNKGDILLNYTVLGEYEGVVIPDIPKTKISQSSINCSGSTNLRT